jgi:hypothetical protein
MLTLTPVARAKLVSLQRNQHPQCFSRVTADIDTFDHELLKDIARINEEIDAISEIIVWMANPKFFRKLPGAPQHSMHWR